MIFRRISLLVIIGIAFFAECTTRQIFYQQRILYRVLFWTLEDFAECRKALGKLRIEKNLKK
jgi:hypothetical protein